MRRRPLEALVQGLATALPGPADLPATTPATVDAPRTLGLVPIDGVRTGSMVLRTLGGRLAEDGERVLLVDLSTSGALTGAAAGVTPVDTPGSGSLTLVRPEGDPALATGPRRVAQGRAVAGEVTRGVGAGQVAELWEGSDVVLVLVEVDPGLDLGLLPTWVERIVPVVTAGRANLELLGTVAALVAGAGVELPFALLERADRRDWMLGHPAPDPDERASEPVHDPAVKAVRAR